MNMLLRIWIGVVIFTLSGCANDPPRIAQTVSGWPEIEINTMYKSAVANAIVLRNSELGWTLEQETPSTIFFTRIDDSGSMGAAVTQALIGNAYSTPPKYEARYILSRKPSSIKVVVNVSISTQMVGGQVNRLIMDKNNQVFNAFQNQLIRVKAQIENQ